MITKIAPVYSFLWDNVVVNVYHANKGEGLPKHSHDYAHTTMCNSGACVIRKEGKQLILTKETQPVMLPPPDWHEIEAIEDGTVFVNIF